MTGSTVRLKPDDDGSATARADRLGLTGRRVDIRSAADLKRLAAPDAAADEDPRRGRTLAGEVHDNYAAALGGAAGPRGAVRHGAGGRRIRAHHAARAREETATAPPPFSPELVAQFTTKSTVPASSRALGWDTMLPTSSCGTRDVAAAFGHVGFTGTSLWIDPERDRYFVLLTNRACGGGSLDDMRTVRRAFHDALARSLNLVI